MAPSLTDRLRGIVGGAVPRLAPDARMPGSLAPLAPDDRRHAASGVARHPDSTRIAADRLGGAVQHGPLGPVIVVDRFYDADTMHGRFRIGDIVRTVAQGIDAIGTLGRAWPSAQGVGRDLLFLDLETTGLAGGAGTRAFLVGCAHLVDEGIAVRQFLLPGDDHERALLAEVAAWAAARGALVTFNGRSFDVPLIETRYMYHRTAFPLDGMPHLDMLHPARRLWKWRPASASPLDDGSCSLSVLEKHLAGVERVGDVPGFEIPARYFQFVRDGLAQPLEAVLEHNRLDLVSLALVMARAITLIERGPAAASDPFERYGLARLYDRAGGLDQAEAVYLQVVTDAGCLGVLTELQADALRRLAYCRRRAGRLADSAEAWERLVRLPRCPAALRREAREALAIHHEHRSRDLTAARSLVLDLLGEEVPGQRRPAVEHRLRRLERKLAEAEAPALQLLD